MDYKKQIGNAGEDLAIEYLEKIGYEIWQRNFYSRVGEIDIIAKDKEEIVFIEVKSRSTFKYGTPAEAVDENKQKHLYKTAEYFLYKNNLLNSFCRFDVIEVYFKNKDTKIEHLKNVEILGR